MELVATHVEHALDHTICGRRWCDGGYRGARRRDPFGGRATAVVIAAREQGYGGDADEDSLTENYSYQFNYEVEVSQFNID